MLMNVFDKKFMLAFCKSFQAIELNCDRENHVKFRYMQVPKEDVA